MNNSTLNDEQEQLLLSMLSDMRSLIYSEKCAETIHGISNADIVIFLGNTRAGKSTIVNYIIGNCLKAIKEKRRCLKIILEDQNSKGPVIGLSATSETTIPSVWNSNKLSGLVVDAPGFDDNRGESQDVANAFYIRELISNANSVKFVFISDINDIINDNIGHFTDFIDKIYTMLPQSDRLFNGMFMVFTKDRDDTTGTEICEYLNQKILSQKSMKIKNREMVKYFVDHPKQIVSVKMPENEGKVDEGYVFNNLVGVIESDVLALPKTTLAKVFPGISDRSRCFLLEAHAYLSEQQEIDSVLRAAENMFLSNLRQFEIILTDIDTPKDKLIELKKELMSIEEHIKSLTQNKKIESKEILNNLSSLVPDLNELHANSNIFVKLQFVTFVDQILQIEESAIFMAKSKASLSTMSDKVIQYRIKLQEKMMEISKEEANKEFIKLTEQRNNDQIKYYKDLTELQQNQIKQLEQLKQQVVYRSTCAIQ